MAEHFRKILKLHEDMEKQVMSIKTNLSDFIDIANLLNLDSKVSELILGETKMISTKIGYYEMKNTMKKRFI